MRASKVLPPGFHHLSTLNLSTRRAAMWLNLAAFLFLFFFGWLFGKLINSVRIYNPLPKGISGLFTSLPAWGLPTLFLSLIIMILLHEMVHALFFWLFTRDRPKFALTSAYAFAAAPEWFLSRSQYILVGLSPFVLISALFLLLMGIADPIFFPYLYIITVFNAAGSFGDLLVIGWVINQPTKCLINDKDDIFSSFGYD